MVIIGTQIRRAIAALTDKPQIDPKFEAVANQILSESRLTGDKGFTGKRAKREDMESVRSAVRTYAPTMPKDIAETVSAQVLKSLEQRSNRVELLMKVFVSLFALSVGTYMMWHAPSGSDLSKWATGLIGTVIGYWLA